MTDDGKMNDEERAMVDRVVEFTRKLVSAATPGEMDEMSRAFADYITAKCPQPIMQMFILAYAIKRIEWRAVQEMGATEQECIEGREVLFMAVDCIHRMGRP